MFDTQSRLRSIRTWEIAAVGAIALLVLAPLTVRAATQAPAQAPTVTSADVSDEELRQFTKSITTVLEIRDRLEQQMAAAQNPEEAKQLQQQANDEMIAAIEENEMEIERYNQIAQSLPDDPELSQRFQAMRAELEQESDDTGS